VMEFNANQSAEYIECEVTAMTFDPTYRRLLTSLNDGSLAIWNFNNGNCLRQVTIYSLFISGVARIWCEEGHETKRKEFKGIDTQTYYKMHAINIDNAPIMIGLYIFTR